MNYYSLVKLLTEHNSDAPSFEAAELIAHFTGKPREWVMLNRDAELPPAIERAAAERAAGKPLQYITGKAWFFGDRYFVSPDVLIPQPDTEHIAAAALDFLKPGAKLLDLCTGSGCIAISILKRCLSKCVAVDLSAPALEVARKNAELHKVLARLDLRQLNVLTSDELPALIADADVITANPPYIRSSLIDGRDANATELSPEVLSEPRLALDGGEDGLVFYRRFIELAGCMKPDAVMILELGFDQAGRVDAMFESAGFKSDLRRDYGGNLRVAIIRRRKHIN